MLYAPTLRNFCFHDSAIKPLISSRNTIITNIPVTRQDQTLASSPIRISDKGEFYAQDMVPGFGSTIMASLTKATALARPSSMVIRLSSCSMESTRS